MHWHPGSHLYLHAHQMLSHHVVVYCIDHNLFIQWPWIIRVGYRRLCIEEPPAVIVRQLG